MEAWRYEEKIIDTAKKHSLSRSRLAAELGITTRTLASRLKGRSEWRLGELVILAELLDIPVLLLVSEATSVTAMANPGGTVATRLNGVRWCLDCTAPIPDEPDD